MMTMRVINRINEGVLATRSVDAILKLPRVDEHLLLGTGEHGKPERYRVIEVLHDYPNNNVDIIVYSARL